MCKEKKVRKKNIIKKSIEIMKGDDPVLKTILTIVILAVSVGVYTIFAGTLHRLIMITIVIELVLLATLSKMGKIDEKLTEYEATYENETEYEGKIKTYYQAVFLLSFVIASVIETQLLIFGV